MVVVPPAITVTNSERSGSGAVLTVHDRGRARPNHYVNVHFFMPDSQAPRHIRSWSQNPLVKRAPFSLYKESSSRLVLGGLELSG